MFAHQKNISMRLLEVQEIYVVFDNKTNSIRSTTRVIDWIQVIFLEQVEGFLSSIKAECEDYVIVHELTLRWR